MSVASHDVRMLVTGHEARPNYVRLCLTMTGKTVATRRDDAINFVATEIEALKFAVSHRDETIKLTQATIQAKPAAVCAHSGTPTRLPRRSCGVLMPDFRFT